MQLICFLYDDFKKAINMALNKDGSSMFDYDDGLGSEELKRKDSRIFEVIAQ